MNRSIKKSLFGAKIQIRNEFIPINYRAHCLLERLAERPDLARFFVQQQQQNGQQMAAANKVSSASSAMSAHLVAAAH